MAPTSLTDVPSQPATAEYIRDLSQQLGEMARDAHLDLLAYLLEMVQTEADLVVKRATPDVPPADSQPAAP